MAAFCVTYSNILRLISKWLVTFVADVKTGSIRSHCDMREDNSARVSRVLKEVMVASIGGNVYVSNVEEILTVRRYVENGAERR